MKNIIFIGIGGFLGSISRFLISKFIHNFINSTFPYGTLVVNLLGCFILGIITGFLDEDIIFPDNIKLMLITGFCGGFTTFSTFINENFMMMRDGEYLLFSAYIMLSIISGFMSLFLGKIVSKLIIY